MCPGPTCGREQQEPSTSASCSPHLEAPAPCGLKQSRVVTAPSGLIDMQPPAGKAGLWGGPGHREVEP